MTEKRFQYNVNKNTIEQDGKFVAYMNSVDGVRIANKLNVFQKENEQLKIRNKGKQAFIDKQDKIIRLLYNQCKDFKEILDDSNITYPIDERLNKFFEKGVKL